MVHFLLSGTLEVHLQKYIDAGVDVQIIEKLRRDLYVDDCAISLNGRDFGYEFFIKSKQYLAEGGFDLRKWATNNKTLQENFDQIQGEQNKDNVRKVLGINWDTNSDEFIYDFKDIINTASNSPVTKRSILRISVMFFDPSGIICPIVLQAKLLFKRLCLKKFDWDNQAPDDINLDWSEFIQGLKSV